MTSKEDAMKRLDELEKKVDKLKEERDNAKLAYDTISAKLPETQKIVDELQNDNEQLKTSLKAYDSLQQLFEPIVVDVVKRRFSSWLTGVPSAATSAPPGSVSIEHSEVQVQVEHAAPEVRKFKDATVAGKIMYVLTKKFKNKPTTETEMTSAIQEEGWGEVRHQTMAPELAKLVKSGTLIKEGTPASYRIPGAVKVQVAEE